MLYSYIHVDWVFSGQAVRAAECPEWCRGLRGVCSQYHWVGAGPGAALKITK